MPSLIQMAFNLTNSAIKSIEYAAAHGVLLASPDVAEERMQTCFECSHFVKEPEDGIIPARCAVCGCGLKIKTRLAPKECPLDKWKR